MERPSVTTLETLLEDAEAYLPGRTICNVTLPPELRFVVSRGAGAYIYTVDGRRYLDHLLGSGSNVLGHSHPAVVKPVREQVEKGTNFYTVNDKAIELAKLISESVPVGGKVRFTSSGSEATYLALRLIRAFSGKQKVLKFEGAYHGFHDYVMQSSQFATANILRDYPEPAMDTAGIPDALSETILVAPYNDIKTTKKIIRENKDDIAGVLVEPLQRTIAPKEGFLEELREVTRKEDMLLVFDEVVTGFRFAYGGAQEYYGVTPDLATYAKAIGGGFPCGAVVGRKDVMDLLDPLSTDKRKVFCTGTYAGNPVTSVAGLATLTELKNNKSHYHNLNRYGSKLREGLREIFERNEIEAQVHGDCSVQDFTLTDKPVTNFRAELAGNLEIKKKIRLGVIQKGLYAPYKIYVSTQHGSKELDFTLRTYEEVVREVKSKYM